MLKLLFLVIRSGDYFMFEEDSDDEVDSSIGADIYLTESTDTDKKPGPLEVRTMTMTMTTKIVVLPSL